MKTVKSPRLDLSAVIDSLFNPRRIAVIGASSRRFAWGNVVLHNLSEFPGDIVVVHPQASVIDGYTTVPDIADVEVRCDVALVAVPAHALIDTVRALDNAGIPAAVIVTGGLDPTASLEFRKALESLDIVVMGPNCMGYINFHNGARMFPGSLGSIDTGDVGIVAQSGSAAIALMNNCDFGMSTVVTSGNEWSLKAADYLSWFARDPDTSVVGLVLESIHNSSDLLDSIRKCWEAGKEVVVLKVGRSEQGAQSTVAHTGALVSNAATVDAFLSTHGIISVSDYDEMNAALLMLRCGRAFSSGGGLAIAGISGGQTALAADLADRHTVSLAPLATSTVKAVRDLIGDDGVVNPLDVGAVPGLNRERYRKAISPLASDPGVDALLLIQDAQETLAMGPEHTYNRIVAPEIAAIAQEAQIPVIVVSSTSTKLHQLFIEQLVEANVPLVRGLDVALRAYSRVSAALLDRDTRTAEVTDGSEILSDQDLTDSVNRLRKLSGSVDAVILRDLAGLWSLPTVRQQFLIGAPDSHDVLGDIDYPVVVKVESVDVPHRNHHGGVIAGVASGEELTAAIAEVGKNITESIPTARIDGYTVQEQIMNSYEVYVGWKYDPSFGPVMSFGSGGIHIEELQDGALFFPNIDVLGARSLIESTRIGKQMISSGESSAGILDLEQLARLIVRLSRVASRMGPAISEADFNPIMIDSESGEVRVVDMLVVAPTLGGEPRTLNRR